MTDNIKIMKFQELNPDIIPPISKRFQDPNYNGGCKLVIVGKPGTGKSTLIKAFLLKNIFSSWHGNEWFRR